MTGATSLSLLTGTLAQANELALGALYGTTGLGTISQGSFTSLYSFGNAGAIGYQITHSTAAVTYGPSWTNSSVAAGLLATFK